MTARTGDPELMTSVLDAARADVVEWFPGLGTARMDARLRATWVRPRCVLHRVELDDGRRAETVVVKVRRDSPGGTADGVERRPTLAGRTAATPVEMARHEFEGLARIVSVVPPGDARFAAVRPLALLSDRAAIVMDDVVAPTMRSVMMTSSRIAPRHRRGDIEPALQNTGSLLRAYHQGRAHASLPRRQQQREEIVSLLHDYVTYLEAQKGDRPFFNRFRAVATSYAEQVLPERLPVAVGHGDLVVRNLFVSSGGQVQLIDPMPRWRVPPYEDLARFVIGMRLLGLQVASGGLAFGSGQLDRYEATFLRGYFNDVDVPRHPVRVYQLLVLLDKWSAAVERRAGQRRYRRLALPASMTVHRYFRGQAGRLMIEAAATC